MSALETAFCPESVITGALGLNPHTVLQIRFYFNAHRHMSHRDKPILGILICLRVLLQTYLPSIQVGMKPSQDGTHPEDGSHEPWTPPAQHTGNPAPTDTR